MKRLLALLLTVCITGAAIAILATSRKHSQPLALIPAASPLIVDWDSPGQWGRAMAGSPLGQALSTIDWLRILDATGMDADERERWRDQGEWIRQLVHSPWFRLLADRRGVLAITGVPDPEAEPALWLRTHLLLVVDGDRQGDGERIRQAFARLTPLEEIGYQGRRIRGVRLEQGIDLYLLFLDNLVGVALDPAPLKGVVDRMLANMVRERAQSMAADQRIRKLRQRAPRGQDFFLYADLEHLRPLLNAGFMRSGLQTGTMETFRRDLAAVREACLMHQTLDRVGQTTLVITYEPERLTRFQSDLAVREPRVNRKLAAMPADLVLYFWSNWLDLPGWWREVSTGLAGKARLRVQRLRDTIQAGTGMDMDRFLSLFGAQVGFNIKEIRNSGFFPVPRLCFCVQLTRPEAARQLIERLVAELPLKTERLNGVDVVSIQAGGGLMEPSYALTDEYLIVADGRDQIEEMLNQKKSLLIRDPDFMEVDSGLLQPSNMVLFVRLGPVIEGLRQLASWVGTIFAIRDPQLAARSKVIIDQGIMPILDGLAMYRAKAVRMRNDGHELEIRATVLIQDRNTGDKGR